MQATTNNRKYGLGFQPGQSFMLKPEAKEGWLADRFVQVRTRFTHCRSTRRLRYDFSRI